MTTRKEFSTRLLACMAAGSLANFTVLAHGNGNGKGHEDHGNGKGKGHDKDHGGNGNGHDKDHGGNGGGNGNGHGNGGCKGGRFGQDKAPGPKPCSARNSDHAE